MIFGNTMSSQSIHRTDEEYYYKLENIVSSLQPHIQNFFALRWKKEKNKEWTTDDPSQLKFLIDLINWKKPQEAPVISQDLTTWNLKFLSNVLTALNNSLTYELENRAVEQLAEMLEQHQLCSEQALTVDEYNIKVEEVGTLLRHLHLDTICYESIVANAPFLSSRIASETMDKMLLKGDGYFDQGILDKALEQYSDAMNIPGLIDQHFSTILERRSRCFFKISETCDVDHNMDQAFQDASLVLFNTNSRSWYAHYIVGRSYQHQGKLDKAIEKYKKCLSLNPGDASAIKALHECHFLVAWKSYGDLFDTTERHLVERILTSGVFYPGQQRLLEGHLYYNAWHVPHSYTQAARLYEQASKAGDNPEAYFYLGMCYSLGHGVKQNMLQAVDCWKKAAIMSSETTGEQTPKGKNEGVARAQLLLGLLFRDGIYVSKQPLTAISWFQKAYLNGLDIADTCLKEWVKAGIGLDKLD